MNIYDGTSCRNSIYIHKYFIEKEIENINKELGELLRIYMIINIKNIKIGYNV